MKKKEPFGRNNRNHGAQYKITIPKFDFKQAAIEEKMVDEVLQGDYDNANSPYRRKKQLNGNSKQQQGHKLPSLVTKAHGSIQQKQKEQTKQQNVNAQQSINGSQYM